MEIIYVQTNLGFYLSLEGEKSPYAYSSTSTDLLNYRYDGKDPEKTFHKSWIFLKSLPKSVTKLVSKPSINYRFELIDKELESEKFPLVLTREEAASQEDYEWVWKEKYAHLKSLYMEKYDKQEPVWEEVDFSLKKALELKIDKIEKPEEISYNVVREISWEKTEGKITNSEVQHQLMDRILFPEIILHQRPAKLSSKDSYDIVRQFVKENINPKVAEVTSDYNFCFSVKKKLAVKPFPITREILTRSGRSSKRPRYNTIMVDKKSVSCFDITWSPECYRGYEPIEGFEGKDEKDLKERIDAYLEELINFINLPFEECLECEGTGVKVQPDKVEFEKI